MDGSRIEKGAKIAEEYREKGIELTDEEIAYVYKYTERKLERIGRNNDEWYFELLMKEELMNYVFRRTITQASLRIRKENFNA